MREYDIRDFGAVADKKTNNAEKIQAAIDAAFSNGGGRVTVSGGTYLTGTVILRGGVELHLASDGVLLASGNPDDFPNDERKHFDIRKVSRYSGAAMIFAEECENISITGMGKIDGNGYAFVDPCEPYHSGWHYRRKGTNTLPRVIFFAGCKNVLVENITIVDGPGGWACWVHDCDYVNFDKVKILCPLDFPNNDGIHINSSRDVTVSNCIIKTGDDCIVVRAANRSLRENKISERVTVTGCTLESRTNAIRIGWVGDGVIRNCTFSNITVDKTRTGISIYLPTAAVAFSDNNSASCGVKAEESLSTSILQKTHIENISFSNITMQNLYLSPVEIEIDPDEETKCECIKNIYFNHIYAQTLGFPTIKGRESAHVTNVRFSDCEFRKVNKERVAYYFEPTLKEIQPFTVKYVDNITLDNTSFSSEN